MAIKVVYVAAPYRGKDFFEVSANINRAHELAAKVWRLGAFAFCPNANTALFDFACPDVPDKVWLEGGLEMVRRSDALIVLEGRVSSGMLAEIDEAIKINIPVFYDLEQLKWWLENGQP